MYLFIIYSIFFDIFQDKTLKTKMPLYDRYLFAFKLQILRYIYM